jgi:ADP-heptose:LPS heptosyltransferase
MLDSLLGCVRRIAVFRALFLGDLMLAVPALRALRAGFPDAEITLIGLPWAEAFWRRFPRYVDRFVEFAGYPGINEVPIDPPRIERFLAEQQAHGYDVVIQMHGSGATSNPFALALGGRVTIGHYQDSPPPGLTAGLPYPDDKHEVHRNLGLVALLGCPADDTRLEFPLLASDRSEAARLLPPRARQARMLVGMHTGASASSRRWPPHYFAQAGDTLAHRYGAQVVLTGGPDETDIAADVARRMTTRPIDLSGQTSLGGLAAVLNRLDLFLTNDTGPAHIAYALGTPSVTLFGPIDPYRWAPLDQRIHLALRRAVECSPCELRECPIDHRCLRWLTPSTVLGALEGLLTREKVA